jgi:hypothetical protein
MKIKSILVVLVGLLPNVVQADMNDYKKYFEVDLNAPIPDLQALEKEIQKANDLYDPKYMFNWNPGLTFNAEMSRMITDFGSSETRIKSSGEDDLYEQIMNLPKEFYPYIGPHLHASFGISEKILNIPGIKETKNKFPTEIAPQLADLEDLEFLSTQLYILLMPQMWPSNQPPLERPKKQKPLNLSTRYDPEFYAGVLKDVPDQGFGGAARHGQVSLKDKLRTIHPTKDSPLTSADVKAFAQTLPAIKAFNSGIGFIKLVHAGSLLDYWESKNGTALPVSGIKDIVNPCQRLALKARWAGMETEFLAAVAPQAFNLEEWAYTCDKTIKAYRLARMSGAALSTVQAFKSRIYNTYVQTLDPKWRENQYVLMQSLIEMYTAPRNDILEALKNETELTKQIVPLGGMLGTSPLSN